MLVIARKAWKTYALMPIEFFAGSQGTHDKRVFCNFYGFKSPLWGRKVKKGRVKKKVEFSKILWSPFHWVSKIEMSYFCGLFWRFGDLKRPIWYQWIYERKSADLYKVTR